MVVMPDASSASASLTTTRSRSASPSVPIGSRPGPTRAAAPGRGPSTIDARATGSSARMASRRASYSDTGLPVQRFHEHVDGATAREPDGKGFVVGDAVRQQPWRAGVEHAEGLGEDGTLDTAAGH